MGGKEYAYKSLSRGKGPVGVWYVEEQVAGAPESPLARYDDATGKRAEFATDGPVTYVESSCYKGNENGCGVGCYVVSDSNVATV